MTSDTLEMKMKDLVRQTQEHIVQGINDSPKRGLRSLVDLAAPLPPTTPSDIFARAVDGLTGEGVLIAKPSRGLPLYDYDHKKAREQGYV